MPHSSKDQKPGASTRRARMRAREAARKKAAIVTELLSETGVALSKCGFPVSHSKLFVRDVARANSRPVDVALFPTVVITDDRQTGVVALREVNGGYRFDQMADAQDAIQQARHKLATPEESVAALKRVPAKRPPYPAWLRVIGYALSAAGFAACFRLSPFGLVMATLLGALVGAALLVSGRNRQMSALMPVLATFASAVVVSALSYVFDFPDPVRLAAIPVLVLLPGAALTAATMELVSGEMLSGAGRMVYAIMQLVAMAFGFLLAVQIVGIRRGQLSDLTQSLTPAWVPWVGVVVFAVGTMLYFCTPTRFWPWTVLVILMSYATQIVSQIWVSPTLAAGLAAAVALLASWLLNERIGGGPVSMVLFLPSFWLIVPGSLGFVALTGVLDQDPSLSRAGTQAVLAILSMAIGVMIAAMAAPSIRVPVRSEDASVDWRSYLPHRR